MGTPLFFQSEEKVSVSRDISPRTYKKPSINDNDMEAILNNKITTEIHLTVKPDRMSLFSSLLGQGFILKVQTGISVRDLICRQIGVSDDYLDKRIQTLFLDGKVVDNVDTAMVRQGSTLALSAALPGLAGATLRRGGAYAAMRSQISHKYNDNMANGSPQSGVVVLKLFNIVALELGPMFLKQGIRIDGKNLENFFARVPDFFWDGCLTAEIDGISQDISKMSHMEWEQKQVFLKLN
jgi:hypothetical protein